MTEMDSAKPVGIVIATHGDLARALVSSAEMIVGAHSQVVTVSLSQHDSPETFQAALDAAIDQADAGRGVLVLIDLFGGTPGNAASISIQRRKLHVVSGVNLPMLLEVLLSRSVMSAEELTAHALQSGKTGIVDIVARIQEQ
jgi:mannose/fructose/sorbose-specific phosphotransferase system IIA component